MIDLITIAGKHRPGSILSQTYWNENGTEISSFTFPSTFSVENTVNLFMKLYETCKWSTTNLDHLLKLFLSNQKSSLKLSSINKQNKWFYDIIINQKIGKENFLNKLLKNVNEDTLELFYKNSDITTSISLHLLSQYEKNGIVQPSQRLSLLRYQLMTEDVYQQFLSLFKQTGSDVNQRQTNYPLVFQCACATNLHFVKQVLQFIEKRFANEQLIVIESFLRQLLTTNQNFHLEMLPENLNSIETIINIAIQHLQQTTNTLQIIIQYGQFLLRSVEFYSNKTVKQSIQAFATKIIKQCYSKSDSIPSYSISSVSESYPETRSIIGDILIGDYFPKLLSKCMLSELTNSLNSTIEKGWRLPQLDSFVKKFFTEILPTTKKLQSAFQIDSHSSMISFYLKNKSTRFERVNYLIKNIDQRFFFDTHVQLVILRSQQYRTFIDHLFEDNQCFNDEKLSNDNNKLNNYLSNKTVSKTLGFDINLLISSYYLLTGKQQQHLTNMIINDYIQDKDITNLNKLKSLRILRCLKQTYNITIDWINKKHETISSTESENQGRRSGGRGVQPIDDIIICLPATMDLPPEQLLKHFHLLKTKLNAANAKYISDAMLSISRKLNDDLFLKEYLSFIRDEQFKKIGITATKEILRLLIEYVTDPSLIKNVLNPLWSSKPHDDVRACIISTLLHFLGQTKTNEDEIIIWNILKQAAEDEYLPVVQSLFAAQRGENRWPLSTLKNTSKNLFEKFVDEIQFKVLVHSTSLNARSWAWNNIDCQYVNFNNLIEKAQQLSSQFDKDSVTLWETAFGKILLFYQEKKITSFDVIHDIIKKLMLRRDEIDSVENAIDDKHDLPVYHRLQKLLKNLTHSLNQFDDQTKILFRPMGQTLIEFDKTLSPLIGTLLIKISQTKEDIENVLKFLQINLSEIYFEKLLYDLSHVITQPDSCPFIHHLNCDEKLHLAQWFIENNRSLFVFELLKKNIFNQTNVDRQASQNIIKQFRQSDNFYLKQQAMEYIVFWKDYNDINDQQNNNNDNDELNSVSNESEHSAMS